MKYVVILSSVHEFPSPPLLDALRAAGVATTTVTDATAAAFARLMHDSDEMSAPPLAVLYEVVAETDVASLHAATNRASTTWPGAPLVACRRRNNSPAEERRSARRLDSAALIRHGFRVVADEPAQLPALLRALEARGSTGELRLPSAQIESAPSNVLLPEKLDVRHLRAAFETIASLHFAADQKSAASIALAGLGRLIRADRWTIYLAGEVRSNSDEELLEPLAVRGLTASECVLSDGDWRRALVGDVLTLSGAVSGVTRTAFTNVEAVREKEGERYNIAVPLVCGERVLGVLEAIRESTGALPFTESEALLLSALALPLAASLANSARIAEAERLSLTDDLTKLHNARSLRQYLIGEIKRARRYGSIVAALFLDLDDFKCINDQHGHLVGSHVLMELAAVILSSVRDTDVVARYGGDEFVVILPETGAEQTARVAERVRAHLASYVFTGGRGLRLQLTASFGIAAFPEHAQSPQQLIACADAAMYEAKAAHKNCVRAASATAPDVKKNQ